VGILVGIMNVKDKIFKRKSGKSKDKWIVRIEYLDTLTGKTKCIERQADRKVDATDLRNKLIDDVKKSHGQIQTGERMTFNQLADICERTFYKPAEIAQGRKVAGIRSIHSVKPQIDNLRLFFGSRLIKDLTTESLNDYKLWRLKTKTEKLGRPVKIATVNRALSAMRKMMRFAFSNGWILKDIFLNAKVIDMSSEIERHRLLTKDEATRLLSSCQGERQITYKRKGKEIKATISVDNPHLKGMIILALDSAMRLGEILKLQWQDIDFENNLIRVLGTNTKTERERLVPLSDRAKTEFEKLRKLSSGEKPFPFTDIKRSFATAKRIAGIEDLHFHDLRRTAITRWMQQGTSLAFAGKFAGHSQLQTTMKHYTATDASMIQEMNERMNNFNSQTEIKESEKPEFVN
jgi:integrase